MIDVEAVAKQIFISEHNYPPDDVRDRVALDRIAYPIRTAFSAAGWEQGGEGLALPFLETTPAMRDRLRELSDTNGKDDYDRVVLMLLEDFARLINYIAPLHDAVVRQFPGGKRGAEGLEVRAILAGGDLGSLPNDLSLADLARQRMADLAHAWDRVERGDKRCETYEADLAGGERGGEQASPSTETVDTPNT